MLPKAVIPNKSPLLYYITDRKRLKDVPLTACVRRALDWGVDYIQIREKDLPDRDLFQLTCDIVRLAGKTKCRVLVNGRPDVAWAAGAAGVRLAPTGLQAADIRFWLPKKMIIGVSVHSLREARQAYGAGAHYLLLGHLFPTQSKSAMGRPLCPAYLRNVCAAVPIPVLGLGGIRSELIPSVLDAGAASVAAISMFQNP